MESPASPVVTLKEQLGRLVDLQALDRKVSEWEHQRQERLGAVQKSQEQVKALQDQSAEHKKAFEASQKSRGSLELEVKTRQEAVKKYNGQLGELKTNEAYSTMLAEIKKAQDEITAYEDKILNLMENEEGTRRKFKEEGEALAVRVREAEAGQKRLAAEAADFEAKVSGEAERHAKMLSELDREISESYLKLFKAKKGMPVARILAGCCEGCSMKVPQHLINEIRKEKNLHYCQHCGRILVAREG